MMKNNTLKLSYIFAFLAILSAGVFSAHAEDAADNKSADAESRGQAATVLKETDKEWKVKNSLFFKPNEIVALVQAKNGIIKSEKSYSDQQADSGDRYISLAGISYVGSDNWIIWLNDKKITPENIPEEIIELTVHKDYIDIKWHDAPNQRVVVFKLQPHQRFHLDTGMLLPG